MFPFWIYLTKPIFLPIFSSYPSKEDINADKYITCNMTILSSISTQKQIYRIIIFSFIYILFNWLDYSFAINPRSGRLYYVRVSLVSFNNHKLGFWVLWNSHVRPGEAPLSVFGLKGLWTSCGCTPASKDADCRMSVSLDFDNLISFLSSRREQTLLNL